MTEHLYLTKRNAEIRRLRFEEGRKLECIVVIINRNFPENPVSKSRVSHILKNTRKVSRRTKTQL